jgi:hypothetical protein
MGAPNSWYNSGFFSHVGTGVGIAAALIGMSYCLRSCSGNDVLIEQARARAVPQIQEADINGNGIPDKFYCIDGKYAVVELDGKRMVPAKLEKELVEKR